MNPKIRDRSLPQRLTALRSANPAIAKFQSRIIADLNSFIGDPSKMSMQYKILWHRSVVEKVLRGQHEKISPVTLEFVPSLECNHNCPVCTYKDWKHRTRAQSGDRNMPYGLMTALLDKIDDAGVRGVIFTGGGEPFANPFTIDGIRYASSKSFEIGLFTNGSLLTPGGIETIAEAGLAFIRLSLNTGDPDNYRVFHGIKDPSQFETVKSNIGLLATALAGTETEFNISSIINSVNVDYMATAAILIREILEKARGARIDTFVVKPVENYGQIDPDLSVQLPREVLLKARAYFEEVREILTGSGVEPVFAAAKFDSLGKAGISDGQKTSNCFAVNLSGSIAYDGRAYLCSERDGDPGFIAGDLGVDTLNDIWASQQRRFLTEAAAVCPPSCKLRGVNGLLKEMALMAPLDDGGIAEMNLFLDAFTQGLDPGAVNFM